MTPSAPSSPTPSKDETIHISSSDLRAARSGKGKGKSSRAEGPQPPKGVLADLQERVTARPFALAIPMVIMAVVLMNITLVDGHYAFVLITAALFTLVADVILIYAAWRGPLLARVIALFFLLIPTQFIASEFARRAPAVFGW